MPAGVFKLEENERFYSHLSQSHHNQSHQCQSHLSQSHQVPIITISVAAHRNIKVHQIIGIVGGGLPDVILDT